MPVHLSSSKLLYKIHFNLKLSGCNRVLPLVTYSVNTVFSKMLTSFCVLFCRNGEVDHASYIHPFIYSKLMPTKSDMLEKVAFYQSEGISLSDSPFFPVKFR